MTRFTVITHLEMMKDSVLIEKVVTNQRMHRSQRSLRIYRVMKMIRRELAVEFKKKIDDIRLRGVTKNHIAE